MSAPRMLNAQAIEFAQRQDDGVVPVGLEPLLDVGDLVLRRASGELQRMQVDRARRAAAGARGPTRGRRGCARRGFSLMPLASSAASRRSISPTVCSHGSKPTVCAAAEVLGEPLGDARRAAAGRSRRRRRRPRRAPARCSGRRRTAPPPSWRRPRGRPSRKSPSATCRRSAEAGTYSPWCSSARGTRIGVELRARP